MLENIGLVVPPKCDVTSVKAEARTSATPLVSSKMFTTLKKFQYQKYFRFAKSRF
jgi:hypothetical protein